MTSPGPTAPATDDWRAGTNPMRLFRVGRLHPDGDELAAEMAVGPWLGDGAGGHAVAGLGVLVDEALGGAVFGARPPGTVSVTSELTLDVAQPPPWDAAMLVCRVSVAAVHEDCGLAAARVETGDGALVALGTTWCRFLPAGGAALAADYWEAGTPPPADVGVAALLGTTTSATGGVLSPLPSHANGLGDVHGGVVLGAVELAGRAVLAAGMPTARTTSVRTSYLRPTRLGADVELAVEVVRAGRTVAVAHVTTVGADGRATTASTVTCRV